MKKHELYRKRKSYAHYIQQSVLQNAKYKVKLPKSKKYEYYHNKRMSVLEQTHKAATKKAIGIVKEKARLGKTKQDLDKLQALMTEDEEINEYLLKLKEFEEGGE